MKVLITGGTGFLGSHLVRLLASQCEVVYVLSRNTENTLFNEFKNVVLVKGDITNLEVMALEGDERKNILDGLDAVLHAAALYDLSASYSECFLQNVVGTQNILHLLTQMKNLKAFYYISTIAVGDQKTFFLDENVLPKRAEFHDSYSETKYLAEKIVREAGSFRYVTRIIRPGIIIGDSQTGEIPKIDGPYYFIEAYKKYSKILKYLPIVPLSFNPRARLPLIPVDHCAQLISGLVARESFEQKIKCYHLLSQELPTLMEFLADLNEKFGLKTYYLPVKENHLHNSLLKILGIPEEVLPFMFSKISYDKTSTLKDLPEIEKSTYSSFKHILFGRS